MDDEYLVYKPSLLHHEPLCSLRLALLAPPWTINISRTIIPDCSFALTLPRGVVLYSKLLVRDALDEVPATSRNARVGPDVLLVTAELGSQIVYVLRPFLVLEPLAAHDVQEDACRPHGTD